jgi:hypothetical protein
MLQFATHEIDFHEVFKQFGQLFWEQVDFDLWTCHKITILPKLTNMLKVF